MPYEKHKILNIQAIIKKQQFEDFFHQKKLFHFMQNHSVSKTSSPSIISSIFLFNTFLDSNLELLLLLLSL